MRSETSQSRRQASGSELQATYEVAVEQSIAELRRFVLDLGSRTPLFVGSGGSFAVARFAAGLHERATGIPARAMTALEFLRFPASENVGVLLFSASARNPDALAVMRAAGAGPYMPRGVLTLRQPTAEGVRVLQYRIPSGKDGFLATNSVLAAAVLLIRAYGHDVADELELLDLGVESTRPHWLILCGPDTAAVATDLEVRLAESGIASAQVTDFRNFAHGRHFGFHRREADTTVVAFLSSNDRALARSTLDLLPAQADVAQVESKLAWPACVPELMAASIRLAQRAAQRLKINLAKPGVPKFGRRLYHLPYQHLLARSSPAPVDRKLRALPGLALSPGIREVFADALTDWIRKMMRLEFGAIVLDHDGTICTTARRLEPPSKEVRASLVRLLKRGVRLGVATGRGRSILSQLREWIPPELHSSVLVGLYNGSLVGRLDETEQRISRASWVDDVESRLRGSILEGRVEIDVSDVHVRLEPLVDAGPDPSTIAALVREIMSRAPSLAVQVAASAHSVDIFGAGSSKAGVIQHLRKELEGREIVAIGDQGHEGGNDFTLLAATPWSLSVDRCSSDPTRCWNLDGRSEAGPTLLLRYLAALEGRHFRWKLP